MYISYYRCIFSSGYFLNESILVWAVISALIDHSQTALLMVRFSINMTLDHSYSSIGKGMGMRKPSFPCTIIKVTDCGYGLSLCHIVSHLSKRIHIQKVLLSLIGAWLHWKKETSWIHNDLGIINVFLMSLLFETHTSSNPLSASFTQCHKKTKQAMRNRYCLSPHCDIWHWQTDAGKQIFSSTPFIFHPCLLLHGSNSRRCKPDARLSPDYTLLPNSATDWLTSFKK